MWNRENLSKWGWRAGPVGLVVLWDLGRGLIERRLGNMKQVLAVLVGYGFLVVGWGVGWMLPEWLMRPEVAKFLPPEIARGMRQSVYNALTVAALMVAGVWVVSSAGSPLASGMVFGMTTRLFRETLAEKDYKRLYWVFAREITLIEHRIFMVIWAGVLLAQFVMLMRG